MSAESNLPSSLLACSGAEDYFAFFGVAYDERVVAVNRLHILRRFGERLAAIEATTATAGAEQPAATTVAETTAGAEQPAATTVAETTTGAVAPTVAAAIPAPTAQACSVPGRATDLVLIRQAFVDSYEDFVGSNAAAHRVMSVLRTGARACAGACGTPARGPLPTPASGPLPTPARGPLPTPIRGPLPTPARGPLATPASGPHPTPARRPLRRAEV